MNFDDAVRAHSAWKKKLRDYAAKRDGSLKQSEVEHDYRCELGQWIHGEAKARHARMPEYAALARDHAAFHKAAGKVVAQIDAGTYRSEDTALGSASPFSKCSSACVTAIMAMKAKVAP